jgi:hypothetical protein
MIVLGELFVPAGSSPAHAAVSTVLRTKFEVELPLRAN